MLERVSEIITEQFNLEGVTITEESSFLFHPLNQI